MQRCREKEGDGREGGSHKTRQVPGGMEEVVVMMVVVVVGGVFRHALHKKHKGREHIQKHKTHIRVSLCG